MADLKTTGLVALTDVDMADIIPIVDDPGGTPVLKKITIADLWKMPASADPAAPAAGFLKIYAKNICGRVMPKWIGPAGVDTVFSPSLFGNNIVMYTAGAGSTIGLGMGTTWTSGGTVSHPTPSNASVAFYNQMKRTRWANVVTTTNQQLGILAAAPNQYWRGNAAGLGGFFFAARFGIGLWPANTVRLFVGLTSLATSMVATDTPSGDFIGLWHDTTDGANILSLISMDGTTRVKTSIAGSTLAAGQAYDFYLFSAPNGSGITYRLVSVNTGSVIVDNVLFSGASMPRNTIFMNPQVLMSNGTANITVTTVAFELNRLYCESDV